MVSDVRGIRAAGNGNCHLPPAGDLGEHKLRMTSGLPRFESFPQFRIESPLLHQMGAHIMPKLTELHIIIDLRAVLGFPHVS